MRGSSVHFKRISSAIHAVSHASREVPPEYLLPPELSLGTHVVIDDHGQVKKLLEHKINLASRQAKATKDYSPMWEGVINLPDPADATPQQQIEIVKGWCFEYEKMTGHKVIRADVHLDEGFVDEAGKPQFNAHAHVMCDRTDDKGKVMKLTSTVLREVQNMTAEVTTLARGLDARTTGRKHIRHQHFRYDAEKNRLNLDGEKSKAKTEIDIVKNRSLQWSNEDAAKLKKVQVVADQVPQLKATISTQAVQLEALEVKHASEIAAIHEQNRIARQALKDSGEAKQIDYMALKKDTAASLEAQQKAHVKEVSDLKTALAEALVIVEKVPQLEAQIRAQGAEIARLNEQYRLARQELKDSKTAKQQDYSDLKKEHEAAVTKVEKLTTNLAKVQLITDQVPQLDAMAPGYQEHKAQGKDPALFMPEPVAPMQPPPKPTRTAVEAPKAKTPPIPAPQPEKTLETVFPRLTEAEFRELPKQKISGRVVDAAKDVLVWGVGLAEAAAKQKIFPPSLVKALEKLLAHYITPEPPAPEPVKATPAARTVAPGRSGVSR